MEELERKNARSAAPFSKNTRKKDPQQPGRKKGKGKFENRTAPDEAAFTEIKDVEFAATVCCACGGELEDQGFELVSITDIAKAPKVEIKGFRLRIKRCRLCDKKYRATDAEVAADQYGATAHRIGKSPAESWALHPLCGRGAPAAYSFHHAAICRSRSNARATFSRQCETRL